MALTEQINIVSEKLQQLLKQYHLLQKDNQRLLRENELLKEQNKLNEQVNQRLQQQVAAIKLTSVGLNEDVKKDLEKRINTYLKEIDKCLNLLNG